MKEHTKEFKKDVEALKAKVGTSRAFAITTARYQKEGKKIFKK